MYIEQAYKGKNQWYRYLATILIWFTAQNLGTIPLIAIMAVRSNGDLSSFSATLDPSALGLGPNIGLLLMLLPSVLSFFGLILAMRYVHKQSLLNIFTTAKSFRWRNFIIAGGIWLGLLIIMEMVGYLTNPHNYVFSFSPKIFFPLLLISIVFIPLQAASEELLFRANIMQGAGLLTRSRLVAIIITSTIFGLMHIANPEVKEFGLGLSMVYYIGFGLFMGILVVMDGGMEMPLAIHAINNIFGSVFVGYKGSVLQTPALFKTLTYDIKTMLIVFIVAVIFFYLVAKQMFNWGNINQIFKRVEKES